MSFLYLLFLTFVSFTSFTNSQEISTDETLTKYYLWSNANHNHLQSSSYEELIFDDVESVLASNFDPNLPTKVLVHGFGDGGTTSWVIGVKNEFLKQGTIIATYLNFHAKIIFGPLCSSNFQIKSTIKK